MKKITCLFLLLALTAFKSSSEQLIECDKNYNDKNYDVAFKLCKPFAERGIAGAELVVGEMYFYGRGVQQNYKESLLWYKKAASEHPNRFINLPEQNEYQIQLLTSKRIAEYFIARAYDEGLGTEKDSNQGIEWLTKSAENGYDKAQFKLAMNYLNGEGVSKDIEQSFRWMKRSANQGNRGAQVMMLAYLEDKRIDAVEADKWIWIAAKNTSEPLPEIGKKVLGEYSNALLKVMTKEQSIEAKKLANEWSPKIENIDIP